MTIIIKKEKIDFTPYFLIIPVIISLILALLSFYFANFTIAEKFGYSSLGFLLFSICTLYVFNISSSLDTSEEVNK